MNSIYTKHSIRCSRQIINALWIIAIITFLIEASVGLLTTLPKRDYVIQYVLLPISFFIIILLFLELAFHLYTQNYFTWLRIDACIGISSLLLCIDITLVHRIVAGIHFILVIPIIISTLYARKKLVFLLYIMTNISYLLIILIFNTLEKSIFVRNITHEIIYINFLATMCFYFTVLILSNIIIDRMGEFINITKESAKNEYALTERIRKDSFTNLLNHASFCSDLNYETEHGTSPLSIAILDIDNFKKINDTYGHSKGDIVLLELVSIINFNSNMITKAYRYGGEEFALIIYGDEKVAYDISERIRIEFNGLQLKEIPYARFSLSIGICNFNNKHIKNSLELFEYADSALYRAKQSGKNKVFIYGNINNTHIHQ